jgi:hypothetical protein
VCGALTREPRTVRSIAWTLGLDLEHDDDVRRALERLARLGLVRRVEGFDGSPRYGRPLRREVGPTTR